MEVFVPDSHFPTLLSKKEQIQTSTSTEISVGNRIKHFEDRIIKVTGRPTDVKYAVEKVYRSFLDKKSSPERKVSFIKAQPDKPTVKFMFPSQLLGRHKEFLKRLEDYAFVETRCNSSEPDSIIVSTIANAYSDNQRETRVPPRRPP